MLFTSYGTFNWEEENIQPIHKKEAAKKCKHLEQKLNGSSLGNWLGIKIKEYVRWFNWWHLFGKQTWNSTNIIIPGNPVNYLMKSYCSMTWCFTWWCDNFCQTETLSNQSLMLSWMFWRISVVAKVTVKNDKTKCFGPWREDSKINPSYT